MRNNMTFTLVKFQNNSPCIYADFQQKEKCNKEKLLVDKIYIDNTL